ncbi:MAG: FtsK/SpoIIIE domain-containing protein [Jatrophihabitantaceae bacterium]
MRIDLTLRASDGSERDVAVLAPPDTPDAAIAQLLAPHAGPDAVPRVGQVVGPDANGAGRTTAGAATHRLDVVGGPDSGRGVALGRRPVTIGRAAQCDVVLRDPDVSRIHAEVALSTRGPTVRDRGSTNGTSVDGAPVGREATALRTGRYLRIGDSFLHVSSAQIPPALTQPGADGTVTVNRPPRSRKQYGGEEIAVPAPPAPPRPQRVGWIATLLPAVAAAALALTFHAPQFLLFALLSPVALLAGAAGDRLHWRRARRRAGAQYRRELAASDLRVAQALTREVRSRRARDPDPAAVLGTARLPGAQLWNRSREDADLLRVRLGLADDASATTVRTGSDVAPAATVQSVPVAADLGAGPLGVTGPREVVLGVARWVLGQLATQVSPGDLEVAFLLSAGADPSWRWARWLPHLRGRIAVGADEHRNLVSELIEQRPPRPGSDGRWRGTWLLVVIDQFGAAQDPGAVTALLADGAGRGVTAMCIDGHPGGLPAACSSVARVVGETGSRLQVREPSRDRALVADLASVQWAEQLARALAPLRDRDPSGFDSVPESCELLPLLGRPGPTPESVLAGWRTPPPGLTTTLGIAADGPVSIDLVRDGPHALVAGTTGAGKSELLRSLVAGLATLHPPESVTFVLVDYKGGAAFGECARLPHTVGLVTDLDAHLAERALLSLDRELTRREELLAAAGARDLDAYRQAGPGEPTPRLVIVIDEFAELVAELGDFVSGLVTIARRGRSLGVHLVLATQRPSGVVSPEIRANTALRIALRVTDPSESRDVIDVDDAATIGRQQPGRAYVRRPGAPTVLMQSAHVGVDRSGRSTAPRLVPLGRWRRLPSDCAPAEAVSDLHRLVEASCAAMTRSGRPAPRLPWLAGLPDHVALADLQTDDDARVPIGLCDRPRAQEQRPMSVDLRTGSSLLVAGGPRSGRTSALLTLTIATAQRLSPARLHLYAADFAGGGLAPLAQLPHSGSLLGADIASAATLIARLAADGAERRRRLARDPDAPLPAVLFVLDGWEEFVTAADEHDAGRTVERLCGLLRGGPSAAMTLAITGDRAALAVRLSSCVQTRLLLKLTDRADYSLVGLNPRAVPSTITPGRGVRAEDGVEVQLAHLGRDRSPDERNRALAQAAGRWTGVDTEVGARIRVRPLPDQVGLTELPARQITLGVGGDGADPLVIDLFAGAGRLLVAGPPRSGRSTVLRCVLTQVLASGGTVVVAAPRRSPLAEAARQRGVRLVTPDGTALDPLPGDTGVALLVDDCESFLDTAAGDALTDWIRAAATGSAVVAAGSSDELAVTFRGVAGQVRRSRCTVLLHPGPGDADLAGGSLPRRHSSDPPGRGLLIGDPAWGARFAAGPVPIQIALP